MSDDHISILLDIKSDLGSLNARMMEAARSRERMEKNVDELKETVIEIRPVVAVVAQLKPEHDDLMAFKARIGAFIWVGGTIASGVLFFLWEGLKYILDRWFHH